jgi:hypothetical protein
MSLGKLTKTSPFSEPFKVSGGDTNHSRLFVWGKWGKEVSEDEEIREGKEAGEESRPHVAVMVSWTNMGPWFPYHEGQMEPVIGEEGEEKGEVIGEEVITLSFGDDDWRVLKDVTGLYTRLELIDADEETEINYRQI